MPKLVAGVFILASLPLIGCGSKPSDGELISHFKAHRTEIEAVLRQLEGEHVVLRPLDKAPDFLTFDEADKYRQLFQKIDPTMFDGIDQPRGFSFDPGSDSLFLSAWSAGLAGSGQGKALLYKPTDPTPLVDDLDAYRPPKGQSYILAYRHIDGDWYLEYDAD
jgi:hypothetical protein